MRLAVGIPWQQAMMPSGFLFNLWETDIPRTAKVIRGKKMDVPMSRTQIVWDALSWGADEILFMDVDQGFPTDFLARLRSHKKDIVSGLTPMRKWPHFFLMYKMVEGGYRPVMPIKPLQEVDGFGFGCVLIKAEVFRKIPEPWFVQEFLPDPKDDGSLKVGHDIKFCGMAQEQGFKLYVDTTVHCTHMFDAMIDHEYAMKNIEHLMTQEVIKQRTEEARNKPKLYVPNKEVVSVG